jgi:4-diphosphocytidyl-2-C-methyl-D-erythritol kinase
MIAFPNAKINLGLYITEKRPDGFHNIETVFLPVPKLCDILEILPTNNKEYDIEFSQTGIAVDADSENNLCVKAYRLLEKEISMPSVKMHLHKQIPMGAGLGGGSADGAFALSLLNNLSQKPLSRNRLAEVALELGSDCPFFLTNKPCFGSGRGENLETLNISLTGYHLLLINPNIHVNTGMAYKQSKPTPAMFNLRSIAETPIEQWKELIINDFEKVVFQIHEEIEGLKNELYSLGAVYASMSGSGSTVFGIFKNAPNLKGKFTGLFTHCSEL